ncbi:hypothetical protein RCL_jg25179.t1 [Rhizophagus clarus]|uniref:Uncharacterized protein n=1 Tax=Rhizophagus clarus TaxID=94130 RepID=A0A8H3LS86_9GLOM|nr:hypothetical protein RCL_jg25179.t1 [Rhizophagus clarus]
MFLLSEIILLSHENLPNSLKVFYSKKQARFLIFISDAYGEILLQLNFYNMRQNENFLNIILKPIQSNRKLTKNLREILVLLKQSSRSLYGLRDSRTSARLTPIPEIDVNSDLVQLLMLNLSLLAKWNALPTKGPKYDFQQSRSTIADNDGKFSTLERPQVHLSPMTVDTKRGNKMFEMLPKLTTRRNSWVPISLYMDMLKFLYRSIHGLSQI